MHLAIYLLLLKSHLIVDMALSILIRLNLLNVENSLNVENVTKINS